LVAASSQAKQLLALRERDDCIDERGRKREEERKRWREREGKKESERERKREITRGEARKK
jgi:hypothetical protein